MTGKLARLGAFCAWCMASSQLAAQYPSNLGFEVIGARRQPAGWQVRASTGFEVTLDTSGAVAGHVALRTQWIDTAAYRGDQSTSAILGQFLAGPPAAIRLRFSGYVRTANIHAGAAQLWMSAVGTDGKVIASDAGPSQGVSGTTPWHRITVELPLDTTTYRLMFGVRHAGDGVAWFDSLSLEIVGGQQLRDVETLASIPRPSDAARLLTNAELALPPDLVSVPESDPYGDWIKAHARPIRSLTATDFSDLRFLAPLLKGKRIVQIGESSHGAAEFNLAKVRLVKYLHQQLGFDVIAFESSIYECQRAQHAMPTLSPEMLMRSCIFGVWHVQEAMPLFEYLKQSQQTKHPLILTGFDQQSSAGMMLRGRPAFFRSLLAVVDTEYAQRVHDTDAAFLGFTASTPETRRTPASYAAFYDSLAVFLDTHSGAIQRAHPGDPGAVVVARQTARSMAIEALVRAGTNNAARTVLRDSMMAMNLDVILDELYPGKKVIVWGHNGHIQHRRNAPAGGGPAQPLQRTMGAFVSERHGVEVYTIGLFMYRGIVAANDRRPYAVAFSRTGTLESILHRAPWRYSFVDFSTARREPGSEWMWQPLKGLASGVVPQEFIPRDEYDGILFVDTVHPPRYIYGPLTRPNP